MYNKTKRDLLAALLAVMVLVLLAVACGGSTTERIREAVPTMTPRPETTSAPGATPPFVQATQTAKPTATTEIQATQLTKPTAITEIPKQKLNVLSTGFGQRARQVGYGFIVENPNPNQAVENSQYQLAVYDAAGTVVQTASGYLEVILPLQKLGVAGTAYLSEGVTAARVDVQLSAKNYVKSEALPGFTAGRIGYQDDKNFPKVTAVITNPYTADVTDARVSVIAYDAGGKIVGGGYSFLNFIVSRGQTGVAVSVVTDGKPARVEVFAALSGLSQLTAPGKPAEVKPPVLVARGFGQNGQRAGFAFLVLNPNPGFSFESAEYHATAYSADGGVLAVDEGYIEVVLPNQQIGIAGSLSLPTGAQLSALDVQINATRFKKSEPLPSFKTDKVTYLPDKNYPKVSGVIISPYTKDVKTLRANAVAYNVAGGIIGGGYTYVDFVPASGQAAVSISVIIAGDPAKVEIYPILSGLSIFE
jgi:hypothetical protein